MATLEKTTTYPAPGTYGNPVELKPRYENFIGGHWVAPINGEYSERHPGNGRAFTEVPRSSAEGDGIVCERGGRVRCASSVRWASVQK